MIDIKKLRLASPQSIVGVAALSFTIGAVIISASQKTEVANGLALTMVHLTGWRISHALLHMILGIIYPDKLPLFCALGIAWEVVEYSIGVYNEDEWWGGSMWEHLQDVISNTIGFFLGILISYSVCVDYSPKTGGK